MNFSDLQSQNTRLLTHNAKLSASVFGLKNEVQALRAKLERAERDREAAIRLIPAWRATAPVEKEYLK